MQIFDTLVVGGIPTSRVTRQQLAQIMVNDFNNVKSGQQALPHVIVSSNGSVIAAYHRDAAFRDLLAQADLIDADGMPLVMATRFFCKNPLIERTATTDFIQDACAAAAANGIKFYFLGGRVGVAEKAAHRLRKKYPGLQIVGTHHGYYPRVEEEAICDEIVRLGTDVLWVGFGSPRQEAFAVDNRERLKGLTWIRTCGGMFDHIAGLKIRAPEWVQNIGLEWLFRAIQEPFRLGPRYFNTNPVALYHLLTKTRD
jgi:N-acetylglucosaminyldiphosphoundecaprenol N-acetyl-beta-D-mannosaminyltransferase